MKILTVFPFFSLFFFIAAGAQDLEYADLYYNNDLATSPGKWEHGYLGKAENWNVGSVDGPVSESNPAQYDNLWVSATITSQTGFVTGWEGDMNFHDFNMDLALGSSTADLFCTVEDQSVTAWGSMNFTITPADTADRRQTNILVEDNSSISVKGDFNLNVTGNTSLRISSSLDYGDEPWPVVGISPNSSFVVGGDFNIVQNLRNGVYQPLDLKINTAFFGVNGVMDVTQKSAGSINLDLKTQFSSNMQVEGDESYDSNISLGGLRGDANILLSDTYSGAAGRSVYISFTNSTAEEWSGNFTNETGLKTHIEMFASSSSGEQTMRFQTGGVDSVAIVSGALNLYSTESMGSLSLSGADARLGIAGQNPTGDFSTLRFSSAEWSAGTIEMDIIAVGMHDAIAVEGAFDKAASASGLFIELNVNAYDLGMWLDEEGVDYIDFDLITFGSTNMKDGDISVVVRDGVICELFGFDTGTLTARLSLQAVPEPAAFAAALGALALIFAARGKR